MDWYNLEPDKYNLLTRHYTPGRGGARIEFVTLHHMAMVGDVDACVRVWKDRPASAHYAISPTGHIGQAVNDKDTAWSNANAYSNARSISIEHSNSAGAAQDWPISPATLEAGAHLVAAICCYYDLGRPVSGRNVRFHSHESGGATACPYHLRPGHKYHDGYMARSQWWYDQMTKTTTPAKKEDDLLMALTHEEQKELLVKTRKIHSALFSPELSRVEGSTYKAPLTEYIMQTDRKIEELHVAYAGKATCVQKALDALAAEADVHKPEDEVHDHAQ